MAKISSRQPPNIVLSTANWGSPSNTYNATTATDQAQKYLDILKSHNSRAIDTSHNYPANGTPESSELLLCVRHAAAQGFQIDSKIDNYHPGDHEYNNVLTSVDNELSALQTDRLQIEYLHWPNRSVPFEEPLRAMNEKYEEDRYYLRKRMVDQTDGVPRTIFRALSTEREKQLFPTLRKYGVSFFAWSLAAGGAVNRKCSKLVRKDPIGDLYRNLYSTTTTTGSSNPNPNPIATTAAEHNMSGCELAIRWILFHTQLDGNPGDSVIIGSSRPEQFEDTLEISKQGLPDEALVKRIDEIWAGCEDGAPSYSPWVGVDGVTLVM